MTLKRDERQWNTINGGNFGIKIWLFIAEMPDLILQFSINTAHPYKKNSRSEP